MMRTLRVALAVFLLSTIPAPADAITFTIGQLEWDDPFGFGPELRISSFANAPTDPTEPIPTGFVGRAFASLNWEFTFADVSSSVFFGIPPDHLDPGAVATFATDPLDQVNLSFAFLYSLACSDLSYSDSVIITRADAAEFDGHFARLINLSIPTDVTPVPEPGSLTLLMLGLTLMTVRLRRLSV